MLVNGKVIKMSRFRKMIGYVEQNDIHDPHTTVREGLLFSARTVRRLLCCYTGRAFGSSSSGVSCVLLFVCRCLQRMLEPLEHQELHDYVNAVRSAPLLSHSRRRSSVTDVPFVWLPAQIIRVLELEDVADVLVGSSDWGIPTGERKRYTIGVELVKNPSVLFLGDSVCVAGVH